MARVKMTARKSKERMRINPFSRRMGPYQSDTPMTITTAGNSVVLQGNISTGIIVEHVRYGVDEYNEQDVSNHLLDDFEALQLFAYVIGAADNLLEIPDGATQDVCDQRFVSIYQNLHNHLYAIFLKCDPSKQPLPIKFIPNRLGTALNYVAYPLIPLTRASGAAPSLREVKEPPNQYDIFTAWLKAHCFLFDTDNFSQTLEDLQDVNLEAEGQYLLCLEKVEENSQEIYNRAKTLMIALIRLRIPIEIRTRIWYALMLSSEQFAMV